jgi:general secretion pathway protein B
MSFILDALKKSEAERKQKDAPGIASIPQSTERRGSSRWMWIIVGLLGINLAVLLGIVFWPAAGPLSASVPIAEREVATGGTREIAGDTQATAAVSAAPASTPAPMPTTTAPVAEPATEAAAPAASRAATLPTFQELRAQGQLSLPDMHIDIHVYSGRPVDRFVFVNMSKYRENATLTEGPTVHEITPEGVVLEYFGTRFLLPRE